jgi:GPI mannosyltransferase 3
MRSGTGETLAVDALSATATSAPFATQHSARWALAAVLVLAAALRLVPILFVPSLNHPDEIFQVTEQAHRLVYGTGLVPWEFRLGIRSWILPGLAAALMEIARLAGDGPDYYLPVIAIACVALAAVPVFCAFRWCERRFGILGGIVGSVVVATAPDVIYLSGRTLSEVVASHVLVVAAYVLQPGFVVTAHRRLFLGGALLGLAFVLRPHLAPALAVIALWHEIGTLRYRLPTIVGGGLATVGVAALLDWATLGAPLASLWRYTLYNIFYHVSESYGVEPWWFYGEFELYVWGLALAPLLFLLWRGAKQRPMLLAAALAYLAVHSGLAHKEYRFIYPGILLLAIVAGAGLAALVEGSVATLSRGSSDGRLRALSAAIGVSAWCFVAHGVWTGEALAKFRLRGHGTVLAASVVSHQSEVCGIGLHGFAGEDWGIYGGYTYLHQPVPMYWPKDGDELASRAPAFNVLLSTDGPPAALGFSLQRCFDGMCVWRRGGGCTPAPMARPPMTSRLIGIVAE